MIKQNTNFKKGFTIIEVVLVLAIAGLIFLMVFVALPNLQRSQRDTQRRDDYAALASNITAYISSNGGNLPVIADGTNEIQFDASLYLNNDGKSADGEYYELYVVNDTTVLTNYFTDTLRNLSGTANTTTTTATIPLKGETSGEGAAARQNTYTLPEGSKTTKVYVVEKADCGANFGDGSSKPRRIESGGDRKFAIYGALENGSYCQAE